jgi:hypothetical protein
MYDDARNLQEYEIFMKEYNSHREVYCGTILYSLQIKTYGV